MATGKEAVKAVAVDTPHGPARAHLHLAPNPVAALVLGHGAGGGIHAPDLEAVTTAALALGVSVVLVEQPYRVAGRRAPAPARQLDAVAALCLAFPLHPPGRVDDPAKSRLPELDAVHLPVLVVQGERDSFGIPPVGTGRDVVVVPGDHSLGADLRAVRTAVASWLPTVLPRA